MSTKYPNGIDDTLSLPIVIDTITPVQADVVNRLRDAIVAIQNELGIDPSREYATVRARLDAMDGYGGSGGGGGVGDGYIIVKDEGSLVSSQIRTLNFIGAQVVALNGSSNTANIYIPPPTYVSHWNTSDGTNGNQAVTESITRVTARISTPNGGEGSPFKVGAWGNTDNPATNVGSVTFTTPSLTTGFGGDSNVQVFVYDADGTTILDSFTTPAIIADGIYPSLSTNITVTITGFATDALRFKAKATITVNVDALLPNGGKYNIDIIHNTDTASDGTGPYVYNQPAIFYDKNSTTPTIGGPVLISETAGNVVTKYISGLKYYTTGSQFTVSVADIDQLNKDTARATGLLSLTGTEYALATLDHSPFGTGSGSFTGWTSLDNIDDVSYLKTDWAISVANHRYSASTGNISVVAKDPWNSSSTVNTAASAILVDTYTSASTAVFEDFKGESYRQDSNFNNGNPVGNWDSSMSLANNEAMVYGDRLIPANQAQLIRSDGPLSLNTNWSAYSPASNPDYSSLVALPAKYYRTFTTSSTNIVSFTMVFSGTFAGGNALADLISGDLQINIWKVAGIGYSGPPSVNTHPLSMHGAEYNNATFDDGYSNGQIRLNSSSSNTIQATFGGFNASTGIHVEVIINNAAIKIDSIAVTFN